jgi:hypothetical protein
LPTFFFATLFKGLDQEFKAIDKGVPDHLFNDTVTRDLQGKLGAIRDGIKGMRRAADQAVTNLLQQISRSEDDVSRALAEIFTRATDATPQELERARARKERGRAPGKPENALGDQINWEQFLAGVDRWPQVWIISRDGDYCRKYAEAVVLNPALHQELLMKRPSIVVNCFTEMEKGLRSFAVANPVPELKLPTLEDAAKINKEQEALPPFVSGFPATGDLGFLNSMAVPPGSGSIATRREWMASGYLSEPILPPSDAPLKPPGLGPFTSD